MTRRLQHASGYEEWWDPWSAEMKSDELLNVMYKLRNVAEHEGGLPTATAVHIKHLSTGDLPPGPPGTIGTFLGDGIGGNGWDVRMADGSVEKIYLRLPSEIAEIRLHFSFSAITHMGQAVTDATIENICGLYVAYMQRLVRSAVAAFGPSAGDGP